MGIELGAGFKPKARAPEDVLPALDPWDKLLLEIMLLRDQLLNQPVPVVQVSPQDLSDVVQAVQGLAGPQSQLTATDIASAVSEVLSGVTPAESEPEWVERLLEALEKLDFRMKGVGGVSGVGGTVATIASISDTVRTSPEPGYIWPVSGTVTTAGGLVAVDTSAQLAGGATFTSSTFDTLNYGTVALAVHSDVASAANGVQVQYSVNGTDWDHSHTASLIAGANYLVIEQPHLRYGRFVYTNGSTATAQFRAQVILKPDVTAPTFEINEVVTETDPAILTRGVIMGQSTAGGSQLVNVKVAPSGAVQVGGTVAVTGALTDAQLRADPVPVQDDFTDGEILADQTGAGAVLTFTFSSAVNMLWIRDTGAVTTNVSRADPFGGTPTATVGIPVANGEPTPVTVVTSSVKVYAPAGSTISVVGYRR